MNKPTNIADDTAEASSQEDQTIDNLDAAAQALKDDETSSKEQTPVEEEENPVQTDEELREEEQPPEELILLDSGEEVPLDELRKSYFRQKDYTHKTENLAKQRKELEQVKQDYHKDLKTLATTQESIAQLLETLIPEKPDIALAQSDPATYQYLDALHKSARDEVERTLSLQQSERDNIDAIQTREIERYRDEETQKLLSDMPELKETGKRLAFNEANRKCALEFGFSETEIDTTFDHRILRLVHYARLGKTAEKNRKNVKRAVVEKPRKGLRSVPLVKTPGKNREAMRRLKQSGSIEDALRVDFE